MGTGSAPPPFQPTIVVPSANPVNTILNPGFANQLKARKYSGYYADNLSFFSTATLTQNTHSFPLITETGTDNYTMMWTGYIYVSTFGDYVIETVSDDSSMVWVGDKAISGYTMNNADVDNHGLHGQIPKDTMPNVLRMSQGRYPIRIIFGENTGGDHFSMRLYKYGASSDEYLSFEYNSATTEGFNP
jgi:hypothetical protein